MIVQGLDQVDHPAIAALHERCEVVLTHKDDRPAWLELRKPGLGGSDIGCALGINPYTKPIKLWLQKTGQIPDDDLSNKEQVYWGNRLERIVGEDFAAATGYTVIDPAPEDYTATFIRRDRPTQRANPDFLYIDHDDDLGVLEAKTGDWRTAEHWADESAPAWYEAQDGWYCDTLGLTKSRIAALLGGNRFVIRDPAFTPELAARIGNFGTTWWERHVIGGLKPDIDGSKATTDALNAMWERVAGQMELPYELVETAREFAAARAEEKDAKARKDLLGNLLRDALADYGEGMFNGVMVYSNKVITTTKVDWEAVARKAAAMLDIPDVNDLIEDEHRKAGSYRRLDLGRSKPAKALLTPEGT